MRGPVPRWISMASGSGRCRFLLASEEPLNKSHMDDAFTRYLVALLPRFLGALAETELAQVVDRLQRVHVVSGQILYRQGEAGDCMHFVVTGRLEVWVRDKYGERRLVAHLSSGDCVGELSLLTGDPRAA